MGTYLLNAKRDGEWLEFYEDGSIKWEITYKNGEIVNKYFNLKPTTQELIVICFTSQNQDEIQTAAKQLEENESRYHIEFRQKLMEELEQIDITNLSDEEKQRVFLIIRFSKLDDATNRRQIVGKYISEIEKDGAFYREIANKANKILKLIDAT